MIMIKKPYAQKIIDNYVEENLETSKVIDYLKFDGRGLETHLYKDLPNTIVRGFPFSSDFISSEGKVYNFLDYEKLKEEEKRDCKLRYFYMPFYHELYIGTTGSGKTTGCIEPQIRAISSQKNKPNIFITDPKGELFDHHATHLKNNGYKVYILNFKDVSRSFCWNPLEEVYDLQQYHENYGKDYQKVNGKPSDDLELVDDISDYHSYYYQINNVAMATLKSMESYVASMKYNIHSKICSLVNQMSLCFFPDVTNSSDPVWNSGARDFFYGIVMCMLEESVKPNTTFTKKMMTFKTVNDIFAMLYAGLGPNARGNAIEKKNIFLKGKDIDTLNKMSTVIDTADSTRRGFLSHFQTTVGNWMQGHIYKLTAETNIDINDDKQPFAIFVATRDYDKSDNTVAGLFIDWVYRQTLTRVEKKRAKNQKTRHTHFLLDEFANIPRIPDFESKIATARSRDIWFHLFVQSYDQLDHIYSESVAKIIVDNCNSQVFLGSQSTATKKRFSDECGQKAVKKLKNIINPNDDFEMVEVPVLSIHDLDKIEPGELYIKRIYTDVVKGGYIRSYQAAATGSYTDMYDTKPLISIVPMNLIIPNDDSRTYFPGCPVWYRPKSAKARMSTDEEEDDDDDIFDDLFDDDDDDMSFEDFINDYKKRRKQ